MTTPDDPNSGTGQPHNPYGDGQPYSNPYGQGQAHDPYGQQQPHQQPYQQPGAPGPYGPGYGTAPGQPDNAGPLPTNQIDAKGFFGALFDFSFRSFITISFAKVIYAILLVVAVASWLLPAFSALMQSFGFGILYLLLGWIPGLILLILYRIGLEVMVSMVRTSQNTAATREEIELLRRDLHGRA